MANSTNLLSSVKKNYPNLIFKEGNRFSFHPKKTIIYTKNSENFELLLLHELGHALNGDFSYTTDIERLRIETHAWKTAKSLAKTFKIPFDEDFAESELDSYRDWLHKKSLCKTCGLTRYQTPDGTYHCPHCDS